MRLASWVRREHALSLLEFLSPRLCTSIPSMQSPPHPSLGWGKPGAQRVAPVTRIFDSKAIVYRSQVELLMEKPKNDIIVRVFLARLAQEDR